MVCLLTDLATLSHHHCALTMVAQAQKKESSFSCSKTDLLSLPSSNAAIASCTIRKLKKERKEKIDLHIPFLHLEVKQDSFIITTKFFNIVLKKTSEILFPSREIWSEGVLYGMKMIIKHTEYTLKDHSFM
jgi:hypothetical protein